MVSRYGLITNTLIAHREVGMKKPNGYWTLERCKDIALQYETRTDWCRGHKASHSAASRRGWITECSAHMIDGYERYADSMRKWTREECLRSALQFQSKQEWKEAQSSAYRSAIKNGWLEDCTAHMQTLRRDLSKQDVLDIARHYKTIFDWQKADPSSQDKARRMGWFDEASAHMERAGGTDNDSVYGWVVTAANDCVVVPMPGYHLVKFGVTSKKRGNDRPLQTMRSNNMQGEIIAICDTDTGDATCFEGVLLTLGVQPVLPEDYDGKTEFRLISDKELNEARALLGA
jgi:hypothetical protein